MRSSGEGQRTSSILDLFLVSETDPTTVVILLIDGDHTGKRPWSYWHYGSAEVADEEK